VVQTFTGRTLDFSVVMPAFNEAARLPESLARMRAYLDSTTLAYEIIVVDDGSMDATAEIVEEHAQAWSALRVIRKPHRGKGAAIRTGVLASTGAIIALADVDLSMPPENFDGMRAEVEAGTDVVIGSREAFGARRYGEPEYRHIMGRVFNRLVQVFVLRGIQDTQCGFKCIRREAAHDLCGYQTLDGWGFDVELLYIARTRAYRMVEYPVPWYFVRGSRVHPVRDTINMVRDVLRVRANGLLGRYERGVPEEESIPVAR